MKIVLSLVAALALLPLAACQSGNAGTADSRTFDVNGTQARASEQLPNYGGSDAQQPYALQGYSDSTASMPTGTGYQAR